MSDARRVVVIGAGIVGACCALSLRRDGHAVTLVDPTPADGASKNNAGFISSGSCVPVSTPGIVRRVPGMLLDPLAPLAIRWTYLPRLAPWLIRFVRAGRPDRVEAQSVALQALLDAARDCYTSLMQDTDAGHWLRPGGVLHTYESDMSLAHAQWALALRRRRGVRFEVLHGEDVRRLEPAVSPEVRHAVYYEDSLYSANPRALVLALLDAFERLGGETHRGTVTDVAVTDRGPRSVQTSAGRLDAEAIVLAAGAWSRGLAAKLGARVPLDTERGYIVTLPRAGVAPRVPLLSGDYSFAATPMVDGLRLAGTVELAGLHAPPNYARARALVRAAARLFGPVNADGARYALGFRPSMPDSLPVIGPSPRYPSVYLAFGHGHIGLTCGAVTARLVADLVAGRRPLVDLAPYRADRF